MPPPVFVVATLLPPLPLYALTIVTLALVGYGTARLMPDVDGLQKLRQ